MSSITNNRANLLPQYLPADTTVVQTDNSDQTISEWFKPKAKDIERLEKIKKRLAVESNRLADKKAALRVRPPKSQLLVSRIKLLKLQLFQKFPLLINLLRCL